MRNRPASVSPFRVTWCGHTLTGTATYSPGDPGKYSGPPEKCYPAEPPEAEVITLKCDGHEAMFLLDADLCEEIIDLVVASFDVEPDGPEYEPDEPPDMTDVEADADTLRSAGMGTDEDYGDFGDNHGN